MHNSTTSHGKRAVLVVAICVVGVGVTRGTSRGPPRDSEPERQAHLGATSLQWKPSKESRPAPSVAVSKPDGLQAQAGSELKFVQTNGMEPDALHVESMRRRAGQNEEIREVRLAAEAQAAAYGRSLPVTTKSRHISYISPAAEGDEGSEAFHHIILEHSGRDA
jgi:hypothetical protein